MNDDLMTLTDTRGRDAGSAVQRAAAMRSWNSSAPKRPVVWLRPALVMAAVVAVIAGLVWVSGRPAEPTDQLDPAGLRYVIGDVPEGWAPPVAQDADDESVADQYNLRISLFGTPGDPTAPVLKLVWQDPTKEFDVILDGLGGLTLYTNLREIEAGDEVAACGDQGDGLRCVINGEHGTLQATAVGLSDTDVGRLLSAVEYVDGDTLIPPASLADDMVVIYQGGYGEYSPVMWAPFKVPGASQVAYTLATGQDTLVLATGWADENDLADAATWGDMQRVDMTGATAFIGSSSLMGGHALFWTQGTRAFALIASGASPDLLQLAESVRPATRDEWADIVVDQSAVADFTTPAEPEGTVVDAAVPETTTLDAPAETVPPNSVPTSTELHDVAVTQIVRPISDFDAVYSTELPDGVFGELQVAVLADTLLARDTSGSGGSFSWRLDGSVFTQANPYSSSGQGVNSVIAVSTDPAATQLRVTRQNGDRYLLDLVAVQNHPELKVGVVMLPLGSFVTFDVVDADGNVLTSFQM